MKKFLEDFKAFAIKGNVIDMAVGVIIGGAFGKIVTSLVNDVLMPLIGGIFGGVAFGELSVMIGESAVKYGAFIQSIVDFLIIAISVFVFIKAITKLTEMTKKKQAEEEVKEEAKKEEYILLLEEIRDSLKK